MRRETELGRQLAVALEESVRIDLADDPWTSLEVHFELEIEVVPEPPSGSCGIDGTYDPDRRLVTVAERASGRRMSFTLLHELGHHLLRDDRACVRYLLPLNTERQRVAEETIADAFAAEILVPTATASAVLGSGTVRARAVARLFEESPASRSACATRAAEQCLGSGYIVVSTGPEVVFAAPFGEQTRYRLRRGTVQPDDSALATAAGRSVYQGTGCLHFPSGSTTRTWNVDSVTVDDGYTFAVFTSERIPGTEWSPPAADHGWQDGPEVACWDCGEVGPSWRRCEHCDAFSCEPCGSCPKCRARVPKVEEKLCPGCFQIRPLASFPDDGELCIDLCT